MVSLLLVFLKIHMAQRVPITQLTFNQLITFRHKKQSKGCSYNNHQLEEITPRFFINLTKKSNTMNWTNYLNREKQRNT